MMNPIQIVWAMISNLCGVPLGEGIRMSGMYHMQEIFRSKIRLMAVYLYAVGRKKGAI